MRAARSLGFSVLACLAGAASAQSVPPVAVGVPKSTFKGGPLDGLSIGDVTAPDNRHFKGLLPSKPNASPVPPEDASAVRAFISGHEDATKKPLRTALNHGAQAIDCFKQNEPCRESNFSSLKFKEPVTANTPYLEPKTPYLRGADVVRIEWLYGSALYYITRLKLVGSRIVSVETKPAWAPLVVSPMDRVRG